MLERGVHLLVTLELLTMTIILWEKVVWQLVRKSLAGSEDNYALSFKHDKMINHFLLLLDLIMPLHS